MQARVLDAVAVLAMLSVLVALVAAMGGVRPAVVSSGSMAPQIPVGALLLTRTVPTASVQVGDVVTVEKPRGNGLVTHRVVETDPAVDGQVRLVLKGDANYHPDATPVTAEDVALVVLVVPVVGHAVLTLQDNLLPVVLLLVVGGVLLAMPWGRGSRASSRPGAHRG